MFGGLVKNVLCMLCHQRVPDHNQCLEARCFGQFKCVRKFRLGTAHIEGSKLQFERRRGRFVFFEGDFWTRTIGVPENAESR